MAPGQRIVHYNFWAEIYHPLEAAHRGRCFRDKPARGARDTMSEREPPVPHPVQHRDRVVASSVDRDAGIVDTQLSLERLDFALPRSARGARRARRSSVVDLGRGEYKAAAALDPHRSRLAAREASRQSVRRHTCAGAMGIPPHPGGVSIRFSQQSGHARMGGQYDGLTARAWDWDSKIPFARSAYPTGWPRYCSAHGHWCGRGGGGGVI